MTRCPFSNARTQCILGMKAFHSVLTSQGILTKLRAHIGGNDDLLKTSYFTTFIIRYSRPFTQSTYRGSKQLFKASKLKNEPGFSSELHSAIIEMRNKLLAHDDIDSIEPRVLMTCISFGADGPDIPMEIITTNKILSYLSNEQKLQDISNHVGATANALRTHLAHDIKKLREAKIKYPLAAKELEQYNKHLSKETIPTEGKRMTCPDLSNNEFLNISVPEFATTDDGFIYEELTLRVQFNGPEEFTLPDGHKVVIKP